MKRVGIVGCGSIAMTHAWALCQMQEVKVVAVADPIRSRCENMIREYFSEKVQIFQSLSEMLQGTELDVLHICTPHYLHVPMAEEALKAGISVFSEKPPAISREQFARLKEVAVNAKAKIGFCFQNRYNQSIKRMDEILKEECFGDVVGARAFVTWKRDADYYATDWKGRLETEGGGALMNQSIHTLDLMLKYLGKPEIVKSTIKNHHLSEEIEVEDTVEAWMTFKEEKRACFYASNAYVTDAPVILELQCEHGRITQMGQTIMVEHEGCIPRYEWVEEVKGKGKNAWGNGHLACMRDFYEKLDGTERFINDLDGVEITMQTVMDIYEK